MSDKTPQRRWPAGVADQVWAPICGSAIVLIVGLLGLAAGQPWLFPSLGPTAYLQAELPELPSARFYNAVAGHTIGFAAGALTVVLLGISQAPSVLTSHQLPAARVWASVLAIFLTLLLGYLLSASHPPAAATTLLVALGGFRPTLRDALTVAAGVLITACVGELLRRVRLGQLVPQQAEPRAPAAERRADR